MDGSPSRVILPIPGSDEVSTDPHPAGFIQFQAGPIAEHGRNGTTIEAVIQVLIERLAGFQLGPFANTYNQEAINHLAYAKQALERRTKDRQARGVEGRNLA